MARPKRQIEKAVETPKVVEETTPTPPIETKQTDDEEIPATDGMMNLSAFTSKALEPQIKEINDSATQGEVRILPEGSTRSLIDKDGSLRATLDRLKEKYTIL